jgi:hypothetical protein
LRAQGAQLLFGLIVFMPVLRFLSLFYAIAVNPTFAAGHHILKCPNKILASVSPTHNPPKRLLDEIFDL